MRFLVDFLVVESVGDLVSNDHADTAVVHGLREVLVVEGGLQNPGRKH